MKRRMRKPLKASVLGILAGMLVGCSTVQPYQKGNLADYTMRPDRDPIADVMESHIQFSREATSGGEGVGGGGCGCN